MSEMELLQPSSIEEAVSMMASSRTPLTPVAGGTDLFVSWPDSDKDELHLLDLSRVHELEALRMDDEHIEIGARATYWQVLSAPAICEAFPLLREVAGQIGSIQIQTRGTWGGNVANGSPAADGVAVMMAYDASVVLRSSSGVTTVPLDQYFVGYKQSVRAPDQLITALRLPRRHRSVEWFQKVGARRANTISKLGVAMVKDTQGWRIAAVSVAPFVCRCRSLERALTTGAPLTSVDDVLQALQPDIAPISDARSTAVYREKVLSGIIYFYLLDNGLVAR